ncbi:peptidase, M48 family [Pseudomonas knackmussii B13]|uniref:Peptidase, M48 family n=1 Tax=Pseudomonas knackmussii (strain DSM 6978 / CCUG 54928 / LMG 23759 / B13) TaxID=1301098 RepID=A0A024HJM8_PSEKB|nr:M48 family metallopeptidase [Pseudomonas knackmussii]CDF84854.1 peptidase, M48 family [Pseudomonas knackmussii B13]
MNFFQHQDRARRQTGRLVLLLAIAVTCLVSITTLVLGWLWRHIGEPGTHWTSPNNLSNFDLYLGVALVVVSVVVIAALYKQNQLSAGGRAVAERLGGRLISLDAKGPDERRVLNVVEEMALASGTPVPPVYLLDDEAINAFAAGLTPRDAVIGITRGAIGLLDRDELQGVIAHEFSHIYNGDMRLNTRLVALLHGILVLGLIGETVLRGFWSSDSGNGARVRVGGRSNTSTAAGDSGGGAAFAVILVAVLAGVALWMLGSIGSFFGNLIKAAVNRQREYLADASAVQFTRNPAGIAGALKKIGGHGSLLAALHRAEFSHLYFGDGTGAHWFGFDTHPPLKQRIRRIEPNWDGRYPKVEPRLDTPLLDRESWNAALSGFAPSAALASVEAIGEPREEHLEVARSTLHQLDDRLHSAARTIDGAQALVYGLLMDSEPAARDQQMQLIKQHLDLGPAFQLDLLDDALRALDAGQRLPLLDLAMPALKQLDTPQFETLRQNMALLIKADGRVKLLEWTLLRIVERNLRPGSARIGNLPLEDLQEEAAVLLSFLSAVDDASELHAEQAFSEAWSALPFSLRQRPAAGKLRELEVALRRLVQLRPLQKPQLLKAMARCIESDGHISIAEAELLRAVADILDCPMPPLLAA